MKLRFILTSFLLFLSLASFAGKKKYLDMFWKEAKKSSAVFYYIVEEEKDGKFPASVYYTDDVLYCRGIFSSKRVSFETRDGHFEYFFRNGQKMCTGEFKNGEKDGFWTIYYSSGNKEREGNYNQNKKTGSWKHYDENNNLTSTNTSADSDRKNFTGVDTIWVKSGVIWAIKTFVNDTLHGHYEDYYVSGTPNSAGTYNKGKYSGVWLFYHKNGNLSAREVYNDTGKLDSVYFFHEDGSAHTGTIDSSLIERQPENEGDIFKSISTNLIYPSLAVEYGIQGTVRLSFVVNTDGSVSDIKAVEDIKLDFGLEEESIRVLKLLPNWKPGYQHNRPVRVRVAIPIKFRLQ